MTIREQIIKEVATTEDAQLLHEVLEFLHQHNRREPDRPRRGSYEAFMRYRGTITEEEGQEMTDIINREFNNIEGEW